MPRRAADATVAVYWQPPDVAALAGDARAAFSAAARRRWARASSTPAQPRRSSRRWSPRSRPPRPSTRASSSATPSPRSMFCSATPTPPAAAISTAASSRRCFSTAASPSSRLTSADAAAWDDLVNAARLDPTRVLDPARFPPRAVAAYKRAAAEAAQLPRADLLLERSADAVIHVDGARSSPAPASRWASTSSSRGRGRVRALGGAPSRSRASRHASAPPLHPHRPPPVDRLVALAGVPEPQRLLVGALERAPGGWTLHGARHPAARRAHRQRLGRARRRADARGRGRPGAPAARGRRPPPSRAAAGCPGCIGACAAVLGGAGIAFAVTRETHRQTSSASWDHGADVTGRPDAVRARCPACWRCFGGADAATTPSWCCRSASRPTTRACSQAVTQLNLTASRDDVVLAQQSFPATHVVGLARRASRTARGRSSRSKASTAPTRSSRTAAPAR